jgi:toxin CcdB
LVAQFDIVENVDRASRRAYPYLVVLQHAHAESASTVVVAPVAFPPSRPLAPRLHPAIAIDGQRYIIFIPQLAAVAKSQAGKVVGSAVGERDRIVAALDMLFTGV